MASGIGQELFNAIVLGIAVVMLAWHNIWMSSHGAQLAARARAVGQSIRDGQRECSILLVVVGLAVLREGAETVLFLYGIAATEGAETSSMLAGGLAGIALGVAVGYGIYAGLLVLLLAAGMSSQAARFLIQADLLPSLVAPIWDTSATLPEHSIPGMLLHSLIGYDARPAGMQVIFYVVVIVTIATGMKLANRRIRQQYQQKGVAS